MTATYSPSLTTPKDKVRFYLGDIDVTRAIVPDETITAVLATPLSALGAAAQLAAAIAAQYAQKVDFDVDGEGAKYSQLRKAFVELAETLDEKYAAEVVAAAGEDAVAAGVAMGGGIMPGGLSVTTNVAKSEDTDRAANFSPLYR